MRICLHPADIAVRTCLLPSLRYGHVVTHLLTLPFGYVATHLLAHPFGYVATHLLATYVSRETFLHKNLLFHSHRCFQRHIPFGYVATHLLTHPFGYVVTHLLTTYVSRETFCEMGLFMWAKKIRADLGKSLSGV